MNTQPDTLIELAERCEHANGPDRELDWEIAEALGYRCTLENTPGTPGKHIQRYYGDGPLGSVKRLAKKTLPRFTASLDAAMTLYVRVPDRVPSDPRQAAAGALRQIAEES